MPATRKPDPDNAGGGIAVNSKTNPSSQQRRDFLLRAVIFVNGELNNFEEAAKLIHQDDLLIAADGEIRSVSGRRGDHTGAPALRPLGLG